MRKRLVSPTPGKIQPRGEGWLDVERAAVVEVTSEDEDFPVELAFGSEDATGWRAAAPGIQTMRLIFDQPQRLRRISLVFEENETGRTQEFVLRWSSDGGALLRRLFASNGISVRLNRYAKLRNIKCSLQMLLSSNWSLSRISAVESLARR
jgi:hypothetical protein